MGMTMTQKILAAHAGLDSVTAGQLIEAKLDVVMANDITGPMALPIFRQMADKVFDKDKVVLVPDHFTPNKDIKSAINSRSIQDFAKEQAGIQSQGRNHVFFLPYLMGERSPHNNPDARGTFIGLTMDTTREDMTQAVLEGVAFAIRDSFEVAKSLGIQIERTKICGGGAKSPLWRRMIANVLNIKVDRIESEEGPALGGAMLAAVACGVFSSVEEAAEKIVRVTETIEPEPELLEKYERQYQKFAKIYQTVKDLFTELQK